MLFYSEKVFYQNEFNEKAIQSQSNLINQQVDEKVPNWINTLIQRNLLSDETSFL